MTRRSILKTGLRSGTDGIHSSPAGELPAERGMSPLQYARRFAVTKMLDLVRSSSPYGGSCPNAATRPIAAVPDSAGSWRGARAAASFTASNRRDALLARMNAVAILIALRRYREMVGVEIDRRSEERRVGKEGRDGG